MIKVTLHKEKHIIYTEDCSVKSLGSSILLRNILRSQDKDFLNADWKKRLDFNTQFLKDQLKENGHLTCVYCRKENLFINEDFSRNPPTEFLATADHIIPTSKGGEVTNYKNMVVACWNCNSKKKDKIGYKINQNQYTYK